VLLNTAKIIFVSHTNQRDSPVKCAVLGAFCGRGNEKFWKAGPLFPASTRIASAARGLYQITQRMPAEDGEYNYRIKSPNEAHERIANESELIGI
jgi:hypothetical protein